MDKENETRKSLSALSSTMTAESGPIQIPSVPSLNELEITPIDPSSVIEPLLSQHPLDLTPLETQSIVESKSGDEIKLLDDPSTRTDLPEDSLIQEINDQEPNSMTGSAWNRPQTAALTQSNDTQVMIVNVGAVANKEDKKVSFQIPGPTAVLRPAAYPTQTPEVPVESAITDYAAPTQIQAVVDDVWQVTTSNGERIQLRGNSRPQSAPTRPSKISLEEASAQDTFCGLDKLMVINFDQRSRLSRPSSSLARPSRPTSGRSCKSEYSYSNGGNVGRTHGASAAGSHRPGTASSASRPPSRICHGPVATFRHPAEIYRDPKSITGIMGTARPKTVAFLVPGSDNIDSTLDKSMDSFHIDYSRPFTSYISLPKKSQSVRLNLDRFHIEQIALRRLRYVIESKSAQPEHLTMMDMIESSAIPMDIVQHYFGPHIQSLHQIRVLLLQCIDRIRRHNDKVATLQEKEKKIRAVGMNLMDAQVAEHVDPAQISKVKTTQKTRQVKLLSEPMTIFTVRQEPTTPMEILSILNKVDKKSKKGQRFAPLVGGGAASYARKSAMEANHVYKETKKPLKKRDQWKPVKTQKPVQTENQNVKAKNVPKPRLGEEPPGGDPTPTSSSKSSIIRPLGVDPAVILSPGNIMRMLEGKRMPMFQTSI